MTTVKRNYNTKDVDMVIAIETIVDSAIANKQLLQSKRSTWADPFFEDLKQQINQVTEDYLGQDSAKQLRLATQTVLEIMQPALKDLTEVKIQIEQDFKNTPSRRSEILNQLGYTTHYKTARKKDQEALINLLYQFKTNLTAELKEEIADSYLFANATGMGMKPLEGKTYIPDKSFFRPDLIVTDVVYFPIETEMLRMAKEVGCKTMNGLGMMLFQGSAAF